MYGLVWLRGLIPTLLWAMTAVSAMALANTGDAVNRPAAPVSGSVLLEISGNVSTHNATDSSGEAVLQMDRDAVVALPQTTIDTHTGWTDGLQQFQGVLLADLLEYAGADGSLITAIALNDYRADIPMSDLSEHDILVAHTWNGERMRVRDRGPLWIIYPSGAAATPQPSLRNSKMVWQLKMLDISE